MLILNEFIHFSCVFRSIFLIGSVRNHQDRVDLRQVLTSPEFEVFGAEST